MASPIINNSGLNIEKTNIVIPNVQLSSADNLKSDLLSGLKDKPAFKFFDGGIPVSKKLKIGYIPDAGLGGTWGKNHNGLGLRYDGTTVSLNFCCKFK